MNSYQTRAEIFSKRALNFAFNSCACATKIFTWRKTLAPLLRTWCKRGVEGKHFVALRTTSDDLRENFSPRESAVGAPWAKLWLRSGPGEFSSGSSLWLEGDSGTGSHSARAVLGLVMKYWHNEGPLHVNGGALIQVPTFSKVFWALHLITKQVRTAARKGTEQVR